MGISRKSKYSAVLALFAVLAAVTLYINFRAARLVSDVLARTLGQPASISRIAISPVSGLTIYNLRIGAASRPGPDDLLSIKSISIIPDYRELAGRRFVISGIYVYSPAVNLSKDKSGNWNFKPLMDKFGKPGKGGSKFTIGTFRIIKGSVTAPGGIAIKDMDATVTGLSSMNPGPAAFKLTAGDGRGNAVSAKGSADILGGHKEADARITLTANSISGYLPNSGAVGGVKVTAVVDTRFKDDGLTARVSGTAGGIRPFKDKAPYEALFNAGLTYSLSEDVINVRDASVAVQGLAGLTAAGSIVGLKKNADIDFTARFKPVDLSSLAGYLPKDTRAAGIITPRDIKVKGSLKPLRLSADCRMDISGVGISNKNMTIKNIGGLAELSLSPDRSINASFKVSAAAGRLTGTASYKDRGAFSLKAENIDIGSVGKGAEGIVNADVDGSVDHTLKNVDAVYRINVSRLAYKDTPASGKTSVEGTLTKNAGGILLAGNITGDGVFHENPLRLKSSYSYANGGLRLTGISFTGFDGVSLNAASIDAKLKDASVSVSFREGQAKWKGSVSLYGLQADAKASLNKGGGADLSGSLSVASGTAYGIPVNFAGNYSLIGDRASFTAKAGVADNPLTIRGGASFLSGKGLIKPEVSGNLKVDNLSFINPLLKERGLAYRLTAGTVDASFSLDGPDVRGIGGTAVIRAGHIAAGKGDIQALQEVSTELRPFYRDNRLELPESTVRIGEKLAVIVSGEAINDKGGWSVNARAKVPEVGVATIQEELLEFLPPAIKWADTGGTVGLKAGFASSPKQAGVISGELRLNGVTLSMPDKAIEVGPVDGMLPLSYASGNKDGKAPAARLDVFDRANFPTLLAKYSTAPQPAGGLRIKRAYFGLIGLDDISLSLTPEENSYRVEGLRARGFGGSYYGSGLADFSGKLPVYTFSLLLSDTSLSEICRRIPPITGYLSGRVDGLVRIKLSGTGLDGVTGVGLIWAKKSPLEKREISKELLKKIAGKSLKSYMLLFGGRDFDTGEIDVVISGGDMVFNRLLISNRNLIGQQDLYITVAPVSNKISLEQLLDVIKDVSERAAGAGPAVK